MVVSPPRKIVQFEIHDGVEGEHAPDLTGKASWSMKLKVVGFVLGIAAGGGGVGFGSSTIAPWVVKWAGGATKADLAIEVKALRSEMAAQGTVTDGKIEALGRKIDANAANQNATATALQQINRRLARRAP